MKKRYLVTGVAGFIASRTAEFLLEQGVEVIGVDNLNDYYDVRLKHYRLRRLQEKTDFRFQRLDIEDRAATARLFQENAFSAVLNLAARAGVRYSMENPFVYMTTNAIGTLNLLEGMRESGVRKMVLASTSSLYAGQKMPFSEDLPVNTPISPYAASKKAAEAIAYPYHSLYGLDISIVRYFTVFGPAGRPDMSIFRFIKWIGEDIPIELYGDGTQSRDFTYIDDIARGTVLAAKDLGYEVINLGGGHNPISLKTIIGWIEEQLGKPAKINQKPFHKADMKTTWADISKAERLLAWKPAMTVREGVRRSVDWYVKNKAWLKDIRL